MWLARKYLQAGMSCASAIHCYKMPSQLPNRCPKLCSFEIARMKCWWSYFCLKSYFCISVFCWCMVNGVAASGDYYYGSPQGPKTRTHAPKRQPKSMEFQRRLVWQGFVSSLAVPSRSRMPSYHSITTGSPVASNLSQTLEL